MSMDFSNQRQSYEQGILNEADLPATPMPLLQQWVEEAVAGEPSEAYAFALATCGNDRQPSVRTVLMRELKQLGEGVGLVFYSNYDSAKACDLAANPLAEGLFFWQTLERQVRISGTVAKLPEAESAAYFHKRPRDSQLAAWVSQPQSGVIDSREQMEQRFAELSQQYQDQTIPLPTFWGGYCLTAEKIEFWQGRANRMHDRIVYVWDGEAWVIERLLP